MVSRPEKRTFRLVRIKEETPDIKSFFFEPIEGAMFDYLPGHFVNISFKGDERIGKRSFSIASAPHEQLLHLTIKLVGAFTHAIFACKGDEEFEVFGPLGLPYIRDESEDTRFVLLAGGSGIVPFRSLLLYAKGRMRQEFVLLDSNRTRQDVCFYDELKDVSKNRFFLTRQDDLPAGFIAGRISREVLEEYAQGSRFIICGPPSLVNGMIGILNSLGVEMSHIKTESWGN